MLRPWEANAEPALPAPQFDVESSVLEIDVESRLIGEDGVEGAPTFDGLSLPGPVPGAAMRRIDFHGLRRAALRDGVYSEQLRVTIVAQGRAWPLESVEYRYFTVVQGKVFALDSEDYSNIVERWTQQANHQTYRVGGGVAGKANADAFDGAHPNEAGLDHLSQVVNRDPRELEER